MRIKVDMSGLNKAVKDIRTYQEEKVNGIKRVVAESTAAIEGGAVTRAPVAEIDGGNLKNSIYSEILDDGLKGRIAAGAFYSIFIEMGTGRYAKEGNGRSTPWIYFDEKLNRFVFTRGMRPQPFMLPSFESERPNYISNLKRELGKV